MTQHKSILIAILIIALAIILILSHSPEAFASKREKAETIWKWFKSTKNPTYKEYREALGDKSNIVEYDDVKRLFRERDLTVSDIEEII